MDRRSFLGTLIGGVATAAAVRTFPFRVFSFPAEIKRVTFINRWDTLIGFGNMEHFTDNYRIALNATGRILNELYLDSVVEAHVKRKIH